MWAIAVMASSNMLVVLLTLGVKALRVVGKRRVEARSRRLESALADSLVTGEPSPDLLRPEAFEGHEQVKAPPRSDLAAARPR